VSEQPTDKGGGPQQPRRRELVPLLIILALCFGLGLALAKTGVGRDWETIGYAVTGAFALLGGIAELTLLRGWRKGNRVMVVLMLLLGVIWLIQAVLGML
jgi:hypothetical protein